MAKVFDNKRTCLCYSKNKQGKQVYYYEGYLGTDNRTMCFKQVAGMRVPQDVTLTAMIRHVRA